jgi:hypothetical protein
MVDVKSMIQDNANKECMSPILAAEFEKKLEAASTSGTKVNGPSFLQRRALLTNPKLLDTAKPTSSIFQASDN